MLPIIENLESIFLNRVGLSLCGSDPSDFGYALNPTAIHKLASNLAISIWANPSLRKLHILRPSLTDPQSDHSKIYEAVEKVDESAGFISSMIHGESEVLHLHLLLDSYELDVIEFNKTLPHSSQALDMIESKQIGGLHEPERYLVRTPTPVWQTFTDFKGHIVPMNIIEKMREVEARDRIIDWQRRGVEMGDKAWSILTDWYATESK